MSRIRITLESVTKAVGSTDLISRFSRLKPGSSGLDCIHVEKVLVKADTTTSNNTATSSSTETTMIKEEDEKTTAEEEPDKQWQQVTEKPFIATKTSTSSLALAANASRPGSSPTMAKQTMQLFHPAALSTNMDETSKTLSLHINSYFGTSTQGEEGDKRPQQHRGEDDPPPVSEPIPLSVLQQGRDHIPLLSPVAEAKSTEAPTASPAPLSPPVEMPSSDTPATEGAAQSIPVPTTSPKKGFTHYLSYPRPSVQAFVGSYIAPLVPKFMGDSKTIADDKDKSSAVSVQEPTADKEEDKTDSEEAKADKVKQQLQSQREKVQCTDLINTAKDKGSIYLLLVFWHYLVYYKFISR